jgi:formimidoylglutamate deiminase
MHSDELIFARRALSHSGWIDNVLIHRNSGQITAIERDVAAPPDAALRVETLLPALANLHSHAFQRAFAGMTEVQGDPADSFWTWREQMYAAAALYEPDSLYDLGRSLYAEMRAAGYGWVCEFHYLHQRTDGADYAPSTALADALIDAARDSGLGLTLLPVLYQRGGFDDRPLTARQQRFGLSTSAWRQRCEALALRTSATFKLGIALHSLRAVSIPALLDAVATIDRAAPIHIHIAEQRAEVDDCLATHGVRPVQWLAQHVALDSRWCLVHATHVDQDELALLARSGAVVGLCPTTEANLGDGVFPLDALHALRGRFGIGSDSHASVDPVEELRWLEYGQRLILERRNVYASVDAPIVADNLWRDAACGGALAAGLPPPLTVGAPATLIALDAADPMALSRWLFRQPSNVKSRVL